jgi:translocation and assembly module TamB
LNGSPAAPQGTITLEGQGLRAVFSSHAVPPATARLRALLQGGQATVTARLDAGNATSLDISGEAGLAASAAMNLHVKGNADLTLLDPILTASGRRVRGKLTFDTQISGSRDAPHIMGSGNLSDGEIQDYIRGLQVQGIAAAFQAQGAILRITQFQARAGNGTLSGSGSVDLGTPGLPVSLNLTAKNARPIVSDLFTASLSGDLKLAGAWNRQMTLSGNLEVPSGEINLPDRFPAEVAVLNVRRRGQPPTPQPVVHPVALDVTIRTSGPLFVRGHDMDAEMQGRIHVGGNSAAPLVDGGFTMTRGSYRVAGQVLNFTSGRVAFDGAGLRDRLDPTINFVAQTVSGGITAILTVTGYASAPKIVLSSTPQLPQDEVVSHLLFKQSIKQLTPFQLASIAQALISMGGVGGGFNPLSTVRKNLGLDRLTVGSTDAGTPGEKNRTTVEAGRYVSSNVYVGVKQTLSAGTQTQVQVDITRRLKAQATLSTMNDATATKGSTEDTGSSVGLAYQFEY